jgi:hypothetical protein
MKAQLGHEACSLKHADGASFRDVDDDPASGRGVQQERDDAVVTRRRPLEHTVVAAD